MSDKPKCDFLIRGDHGQVRCDCEAKWWRHSAAGGLFYYCDTCARGVEHATRGKISLHKVVER